MLKILSSQRYKGGMRLSVLSGRMLLERINAIYKEAVEIGGMLSAKTTQISSYV